MNPLIMQLVLPMIASSLLGRGVTKAAGRGWLGKAAAGKAGLGALGIKGDLLQSAAHMLPWFLIPMMMGGDEEQPQEQQQQQQAAVQPLQQNPLDRYGMGEVGGMQQALGGYQL